MYFTYISPLIKIISGEIFLKCYNNLSKMSTTFVGRKEEKAILQEALASNEAEMVAVIGRRRVGKTFLIEHEYKDRLVFHITGLQDAPLQEQLENFTFNLQNFSKSKLLLQTPKSWLKAFMQLINYLETLDWKKKKVVFLDELSWMATRRSGFLRALGFFWNSWAVNKNIVIVICGSAASWMIQKVINHRGGLHNRITKRIFLKPFTLAETKDYLLSKKINFNPYQIAQIYMVMGGIPHYLKEVKGYKSAVQNIDDICFSDSGLLKEEFSRLYVSLFENAENHVAVIRALAATRQGLTRSKIITNAKLSEGGSSTKTLEELTQSGFITLYYPFGKKKKDLLYRLTDEYSLFYLKFMEKKKHDGRGTWKHLSQTQMYKTWSGYAYENLCLKHLSQIKKALGISGIYSTSSSFLKRGTTENKGTQIDLVLDRSDHTINLFEIKFSSKEFVLTKSYAKSLQEKTWIFEEATKTRKQLFLTLITTFGIKHNEHSLGLIQQVLTLDDLFEY